MQLNDSRCNALAQCPAGAFMRASNPEKAPRDRPRPPGQRLYCSQIKASLYQNFFPFARHWHGRTSYMLAQNFLSALTICLPAKLEAGNLLHDSLSSKFGEDNHRFNLSNTKRCYEPRFHDVFEPDRFTGRVGELHHLLCCPTHQQLVQASSYSRAVARSMEQAMAPTPCSIWQVVQEG